MPIPKAKKPSTKNLLRLLSKERISQIAKELGDPKWPESYAVTSYYEGSCWSCHNAPFWVVHLKRNDGTESQLRFPSGIVPTCFDEVFLCYNCERKFERVPYKPDGKTTEMEQQYQKLLKSGQLLQTYKMSVEHKAVRQESHDMTNQPLSNNTTFFPKPEKRKRRW